MTSQSTTFEAAKQKLELGNPPFALEDLPQDNNDSLWSRIESTYGLTLPQVSVLKNYVRQQQQQKEYVSSKRQRSTILKMEISIDDVSEGILQKLRTSAISLQPCAEAAKLYMKSNRLDLPILGPDLDTVRNRLSQESINLNSFAENSKVQFKEVATINQVPTGLLEFLFYIDHSSFSWTGESEDEIHSYVETSITGPFRKFFGNTFRISRNKALKTSSGRADYSISSDNFQLFRGEDKMRARVKREDPRKELVDKSPKGKQWITLYGPDVPYIFGYYSLGGTDNLLLQFVCIERDKNQLVHLTDTPFDLMKYSGVLGCRLFCLSLMPHLLAVKKNITSPFGLDWKISRRLEGNSVWQSSIAHIGLDQTEGDCCFVKDLFYDMKSASDQAKSLVEQWENTTLPEGPNLLKLRRIDNRENIPEEGTGRVRRIFAPLCQPNSMTGQFHEGSVAKIAILHVSKAVQALHAAGLIHNDVRWSNVVRHQSENVFVLIDYDDIAKVDESGNVPGIEWMDSSSHAPDITKVHNQLVDIWGLCNMISELECGETNALKDLVVFGRTCLDDYPNSVSNESFYPTLYKLCGAV